MRLMIKGIHNGTSHHYGIGQLCGRMSLIRRSNTKP
jgi:hypothetical protein